MFYEMDARSDPAEQGKVTVDALNTKKKIVEKIVKEKKADYDEKLRGLVTTLRFFHLNKSRGPPSKNSGNGFVGKNFFMLLPCKSCDLYWKRSWNNDIIIPLRIMSQKVIF
jgi:hypothetical protein